MKTRVLVVDDSALMRGLLTEMIGSAADMEVVGSAPDAVVARDRRRGRRSERGFPDLPGRQPRHSRNP